jgi:hypothetical protein
MTGKKLRTWTDRHYPVVKKAAVNAWNKIKTGAKAAAPYLIAFFKLMLRFVRFIAVIIYEELFAPVSSPTSAANEAYSNRLPGVQGSQAAINHEAIAVELSEALKKVASKIGVDPPDNPMDIYDTVHDLPSDLKGSYFYQANRNTASIVAMNHPQLGRCSAQRATQILQRELVQRSKTYQSALRQSLNVEVFDTANGLAFKIIVRVI